MVLSLIHISFTLSGGTIELTDLDYDADVTIFNFGTLNISGGTVRGVTAVYNYAPVALRFTGNAVCNLTGGTIEGVACTTHNDQPDESKKGIGANWACVLMGEGIDAVSYTHLDVYKRQGQYNGRPEKCPANIPAG